MSQAAQDGGVEGRVLVAAESAYKLLNHGPTALVSVADGSRRNVMAAAWVMAIDFVPPKVAVVISADTYTRQILEVTGKLALSLPTVAQADLTFTVGRTSGRDVDKLAAFSIAALPGPKTGAPLIGGCVAWLECELTGEPSLRAALAKDYDLFLAEVVAAWADPRVFVDGEWNFEGHPELCTLHHQSRGAFFATGERVQGKKLAPGTVVKSSAARGPGESGRSPRGARKPKR